MESAFTAFTRAHITVLKFDVHLFPRKYHVTHPKDATRRVLVWSMITEISMTSGSPFHVEIPKYVLGIPLNTLETPLLGSALSFHTPFWQQQTYAAALTTSHFATFVSSTTTILKIHHPKAEPKDIRIMKILTPRHLKAHVKLATVLHWLHGLIH